MYELADNSINLLLTRLKKGVIILYQRAVKFKNENVQIVKTKEMERYTTMTLNIMDVFCDKITAFFAKNPTLVSALDLSAKAYFIQASTPEMFSAFKYLQKLRWIDPTLVPHVESKYYAYWKSFWAGILTRTLCSDNICLGEDVCHKIAEFIPEKIVGASFIEFFQQHFDIETQTFIGKKHFGVTCTSSHHRTEFVVVLN